MHTRIWVWVFFFYFAASFSTAVYRYTTVMVNIFFQAIMEEIANFEECLTSLKEKGDGLVSRCSEQVQAKLSQQIQAHQQGTKDSYSAICSTAQRVSIFILYAFSTRDAPTTFPSIFIRYVQIFQKWICLNQLKKIFSSLTDRGCHIQK